GAGRTGAGAGVSAGRGALPQDRLRPHRRERRPGSGSGVLRPRGHARHRAGAARADHHPPAGVRRFLSRVDGESPLAVHRSLLPKSPMARKKSSPAPDGKLQRELWALALLALAVLLLLAFIPPALMGSAGNRLFP